MKTKLKGKTEITELSGKRTHKWIERLVFTFTQRQCTKPCLNVKDEDQMSLIIQPPSGQSAKSVALSVVSGDDTIQAEIHVIVHLSLAICLPREREEAEVFHATRVAVVVVPQQGLVTHDQRQFVDDKVVVET